MYEYYRSKWKEFHIPKKVEPELQYQIKKKHTKRKVTVTYDSEGGVVCVLLLE